MSSEEAEQSSERSRSAVVGSFIATSIGKAYLRIGPGSSQNAHVA
jgi:hypothetical protein